MKDEMELNAPVDEWCKINDGCLATSEGTTEKISVVMGSIPTWNSEIFSVIWINV